MPPSRAARAPRPLWACPRCGARFLTRNSPHSCGRFPLDDLFLRAEPHVRPLFDRLAEMVREAGEATLVPQKTRGVFMTRMRFINAQVRRSHLIVGFILRRRPADRRFDRVEAYGPRTYGAYLRVSTLSELDDDVRRWIREAYVTGSGARGTGSPRRRAG